MTAIADQGNVIPLAGNKARLTPTLMKACKPNCKSSPETERKRSIAFLEKVEKPAKNDQREQGKDAKADYDAEFLARNGEDKIRMASGRMRFTSPRPDPGQRVRHS